MDEHLPNPQFDAIVVGTGLVESVVAGAASRVGRRVLHLDPADVYGSEWSSLCLSDFRGYVAAAERGAAPPPSSSAAEVTIEPGRVARTDGTYSAEALAVRPAVRGEGAARFVGVEFWEAPEGGAPPAPGYLVAGTDGEYSWVPPPPSPEPWSKLVAEDRRYALDVVPRLAFCRGELVELLISSGLHRYAEFRSVEASYLYADGGLQHVPCSKGEVFKSKSISMLEKRLLMKLLATVMAYDASEQGTTAAAIAAAADTGAGSATSGRHESEVLRQKASLPITEGAGGAKAVVQDAVQFKDRPFAEFLELRKIKGSLRSFIWYALALQTEAPEANDRVLSTHQGIKLLRRYILCLGRFADTHTAFLCTMYGGAEIPQAFCRCCAVYGGTYVLRRAAQSLVLSERAAEAGAAAARAPRLRGIVCSTGQHLQTEKLVASREHVSALLGDSTKRGSVARAVCVAAGPLRNTAGTVVAFLPPGTVGNGQVIRVQQFDASTKMCPAGKHLIHLSTQGDDGGAHLRAAAKLLFSMALLDAAPSDEAEADRPMLLWCAFFEKELHELPDSLPSGVHVTSDAHFTALDFDNAVAEGRAIFHYLFPDDAFLPPLPDPEDGQVILMRSLRDSCRMPAVNPEVFRNRTTCWTTRKRWRRSTEKETRSRQPTRLKMIKRVLIRNSWQKRPSCGNDREERVVAVLPLCTRVVD